MNAFDFNCPIPEVGEDYWSSLLRYMEGRQSELDELELILYKVKEQLSLW